MLRLMTIALCLFMACPKGLKAADEGYVLSDGAQLQYRDEGDGAAVLLIHGYSSNLEWWRENGVYDALLKAGYRVIAYDNRGHGRSDRPHSVDQYGLKMIHDAERVLEHRRINKAHVVGYSMGAAIACKFRELYADRILSVTLGGYGRPPLPKSYSKELVQQIETNLRKMELLEGNDAEALGYLSVGWSQWVLDPTRTNDNPTPILALVGRDDPFIEDSRKLSSTVTGLRVQVLPGDHGSLPQQAEFIGALLQHLETHSPAGDR